MIEYKERSKPPTISPEFSTVGVVVVVFNEIEKPPKKMNATLSLSIDYTPPPRLGLFTKKKKILSFLFVR
jgi:hypothetical protein